MTSIRSGVSQCALCGQQLVGGVGLCAAHHSMPEVGWAAANRIMCDFFHRGIAAPRLSPSEAAGDPTHRADTV